MIREPEVEVARAVEELWGDETQSSKRQIRRDLARRAVVEQREPIDVRRGVTILSMEWDEATNSVLMEGEGGGVSWPVRVVNPPVFRADHGGEFARGSEKFAFDPIGVLVDVVADLADREG